MMGTSRVRGAGTGLVLGLLLTSGIGLLWPSGPRAQTAVRTAQQVTGLDLGAMADRFAGRDRRRPLEAARE